MKLRENHFIPFNFGFRSSNLYETMEYLTEHLGLERQNELKVEIYNSIVDSIDSNKEEEINHKVTLLHQEQRQNTGSEKLREKSHTCYVCNKVLSSTSSYYVHMKQHSGHKPYHCPMCDVSFCRKPYLEVHLRTHTGERPFQCEICLKRFTQKSSLNIHRRAHTGERPYSCDFCDKKFAVKSYSDAHRWTHVFEKPLACEKCHIPFSSRAQYVLHLKSHSSSLPFECICGRTFSKNSYLIRHQIKVHHPPASQLTIDENPSSSDLIFNPIFASINSSNKKNNYEIGNLIGTNVSRSVEKVDKQTNTDSYKKSSDLTAPSLTNNDQAYHRRLAKL